MKGPAIQRQLEEPMGPGHGPDADGGETPMASAALPPPSRQQHVQARLMWIPSDKNSADAPSRSLDKVGVDFTAYVHDVRAQRRALPAERSVMEEVRPSIEGLMVTRPGPTGQKEKLKAREALPQPTPEGTKGGLEGAPAPEE